MRTTLKRGIRQVDGLNGNGHSRAPLLLGPVARYRQPEPPGRSVVGALLRGFGWLVLAIVVLASGIAGGYYLYVHESVGELNGNHDVVTAKAKQRLQAIKSPSQPAIALIAGYDHRAGTGTNSYAGSNSDTLMLVRADPTNHTLSLLSFPRDLSVNIYCHGDTVYTQDRINAAWAVCGDNGPYATLDTIEHLTGLKINYLITLDFHAFKQLVNRLHGVYLNVDRRYYIPPHTGTSAINLYPGYQKLDGGQALSFVRFRHFDSDLYRTGRQQLFLEALKTRLRTELSLSTLPLELPKLIHVLKGNLEYLKAGGGNVSIPEIASYLGIAYHLPPGHLFRDQIPVDAFQPYVTAAGADELTAPQSAIDEAVHQFLHPNVAQAQLVDRHAGGKKTHPKPAHRLRPAQVSVLVLNAGTAPGRAADTTYLLTKRHFATKTLPASTPADAPALAGDTVVYYDPVQPHAKAAAQVLEPLFGAHSRIAPMTAAIAPLAQKAGNPLTVVAVGKSFAGKLTIPQRTRPAAPSVPPQVSDGVSVTASAIHGMAKEARFPLMVPHQVAEGAQLSSEEGTRLFRPLRGHQELVLTFLQPNGIQYWQIEETDWNSAPVLASPTGHIVHGHRRFDLYTTGGSIQMVVLRTPRASYWVVNTLLNQLSNSTMIAIAESLQPLGR